MPAKNRQRKVNVVEDDAEIKTRRSFTLTDAGMVVLGKPCEAQYYVAQHYPLLTMAILKAGPSVKELLRSIPQVRAVHQGESQERRSARRGRPRRGHRGGPRGP